MGTNSWVGHVMRMNPDTPAIQFCPKLSQTQTTCIYTIIFLVSVCRCSQTAGRNSYSIVSGDVSNCSHRLTVHPVTSSRISSAYTFLYTKTPKTSGKAGRQRQCLFQWPATSIVASGTGRHGWAPTNSDSLYGGDGDGGVCVPARVCARACVRAHACACVRACVRDVFSIYDNNILPTLIMIIIKSIILYFIQIRHTDDFPSTGIRLVSVKQQ